MKTQYSNTVSLKALVHAAFSYDYEGKPRPAWLKKELKKANLDV
jgi:hypothetical protein